MKLSQASGNDDVIICDTSGLIAYFNSSDACHWEVSAAGKPFTLLPG
jgi:hypothetical protein